MGWMLGEIISWFAGLVADSFDEIWKMIIGGLLATPDVTVLPQVQALTTRAVWIIDTVFILVFVAIGVITVTAGGGERARFTAKELLPRAVVGFIGSHFSLLLCSQALQLADALTRAVGDQPLSGDAGKAMRSHLMSAGNSPAGALLFAVIGGLVVVLLGSVVFQMIVRFALLLVLTAIAPLALAAHALPATDGLARMWWRTYAGCLLTPVAQSFMLTAGMWMLLDPGHLLPVFGLPGDGGMLNLFVVAVLLWTTVKVPKIVGRYVTQSQPGGQKIAALIKTVVVRKGVAAAVPGAGALI